MKTERRHELETNALAKELARWIELLKPYSKAAAGVIVAAVVIAAVTRFVTRQGTHAEAAAWNDYYRATSGMQPGLDGLRAVADAQRGTSVEPWARIAWADGQLLLGSQLLFVDRDQAAQALKDAMNAYLELRGNNHHEMIRQRATYGLARAYESLGRLDQAHKVYGEVAGAFAEAARARAGLLAERDAKEFYDWFTAAKLPQPVGPGDPGTPGQRPDFSVGETAVGAGLDDVPLPVVPPAVPPAEMPPAGGGASEPNAQTDPSGDTPPQSTASPDQGADSPSSDNAGSEPGSGAAVPAAAPPDEQPN